MKILTGLAVRLQLSGERNFSRNEPVPGWFRSLSVSGEHELAASQEARSAAILTANFGCR